LRFCAHAHARNARALTRRNAPRSALADGSSGYDERVHAVAVLLSNMGHLLSSLRRAQAADALEASLVAALGAKRERLAALRARAAEADAAAAAAAETLAAAL
jgi:hypothetical protein